MTRAVYKDYTPFPTESVVPYEAPRRFWRGSTSIPFRLLFDGRGLVRTAPSSRPLLPLPHPASTPRGVHDTSSAAVPSLAKEFSSRYSAENQRLGLHPQPSDPTASSLELHVAATLEEEVAQESSKFLCRKLLHYHHLPTSDWMEPMQFTLRNADLKSINPFFFHCPSHFM